jgi:hypothetical protein
MAKAKKQPYEMNTDELLVFRHDKDVSKLAVQLWEYVRSHCRSLDSERHCTALTNLASAPVVNQQKEILRLTRKVKKLEKKLAEKTI